MHIFFSVGEPSGDQHAAHLMQEMRRRRGDLEFSGFGGPLMEQAGCRLIYRLTDLAVMGFFSVLPMLRKFLRLVKQAEEFFGENRPDAVVLIDFPGFNWQIAKRAKAAGIPVFYYMPPQLWAWGPWRIGRVRKWVDHVLCGLPFEQQWYVDRGIAAEYVGHPFFDEAAEYPLDQDFLATCAKGNQQIVGVLPGSRRREVEGNWPIMVEVLSRVHARSPSVQILVAGYKDEYVEYCRQYLESHGVTLPISYHVGKTPDIIAAADCCLMVSGSVSLQMVARQTPAAVLYRVNKLSYPLTRALVRIDSITLPNLCAGRRVLPEWVVVFHPERDIADMAEQLHDWLAHPEKLADVADELERLHAEIGRAGSIYRAATSILSHLPAEEIRRAA